MGSKPKPPPAPDYMALAKEQARLQNELVDKQTANNRVNQITPNGTITWQQDPVTGAWTQVEAYNQEILDQQKADRDWTYVQRDYERERMDFERQRMAQESIRMQEQMGYDKQRADYEVQRMQQAGAFEDDLMEYERGRMANETQRMGKQNTYDDARMQYEMQRMNDSSAYNKERAAFQAQLMGLTEDQIAHARSQMGFDAQRMGFAGEQMDFARDQMGMYRGAMDKIKNLGEAPSFSAPALPEYSGAYGDAYATDFMKSALMRVLPQQQKEAEGLQNKLRLQGLQPGTRAYDDAYKNLMTAHGDVQAKAALDGMMAGGSESRATYLAQLQGQGQGFEQSMQSYLMPWQTAQMEVAMMRGLGDGVGQGIGDGVGQQTFGAGIGSGIGGDVYGTGVGADIFGGAGQGIQYGIGPQGVGADVYGGAGQGIGNNYGQGINTATGPSYQGYNQAGAYEAPQISNAAQQQYAQKMQAYNEAQQAKSAKGGSIGSMVGAVGGAFFGMPQVGAALGGSLGSSFSDLRLKHDVKPLSDAECYEKMKKIIPINWKWNGTSVEDSGISAQQILEELPHLTDRAERGMLAVNYTALFAMLLGAFRHLATVADKNKEPGHAAV